MTTPEKRQKRWLDQQLRDSRRATAALEEQLRASRAATEGLEEELREFLAATTPEPEAGDEAPSEEPKQ